jgi:hypothetical protein
MNDLKIVFFAVVGLVAGAVMGFIGPLLICYSYDAITSPPPGSGLMTVGWIFCFITIPVFAIIGCVWSSKVASKKFKRQE